MLKWLTMPSHFSLHRARFSDGVSLNVFPEVFSLVPVPVPIPIVRDCHRCFRCHRCLRHSWPGWDTWVRRDPRRHFDPPCRHRRRGRPGSAHASIRPPQRPQQSQRLPVDPAPACLPPLCLSWLVDLSSVETRSRRRCVQTHGSRNVRLATVARRCSHVAGTTDKRSFPPESSVQAQAQVEVQPYEISLKSWNKTLFSTLHPSATESSCRYASCSRASISANEYPRLLFESSMENAIEQPVILSGHEPPFCKLDLRRHGVHRVPGSSEGVSWRVASGT